MEVSQLMYYRPLTSNLNRCEPVLQSQGLSVAHGFAGEGKQPHINRAKRLPGASPDHEWPVAARFAARRNTMKRHVDNRRDMKNIPTGLHKVPLPPADDRLAR
jgi:hypothetical protein